ncbi:MAG: hypothetical protein KAR57_03030, partial [Bacteroidales bacterium]|nr:hypothetical protein [Bacteroidales bacterium]
MKNILHNFKKTLVLVLFVSISSIAFSQTATPPATGDGSVGNPYEIATLNNLYWLSQNSTEWDKHYIQTTDIDASTTVGWDNDSGFTPIGNPTIKFTGTYDGKSHTIDSLYINRPETSHISFIGSLGSTASVDSLGLTNINFTAYDNIGGMVAHNDGAISNCYTTGNISTAKDGTVNAGGVVGYNIKTINNCYSKVNITATNGERVAGLVGTNYDIYAEINNCYSTGEVVSTANYIGGLIGRNMSGNVNNSLWDTETSGISTSSGGTGLTTNEMKDVKNYLNAGWDFMDETYNGTDDEWGINSTENGGYPFLKWQAYTNEITCEAPFAPASDIIITDIDTDSINLESFTEAGYGAVGYVIYMNTEDNWIVPGDGDEPTANTVWQNSGQQCIYFGISNSPNITVTGLNYCDPYYLKVYAYNDCGGTEIYEINGELGFVDSRDTVAPIPDVTSLADITGQCSVTVSETPLATDNCSGSITGTTSDPLSYTEQGTDTITWTYDDGNGNIYTQEQIVIVNDDTNPGITCITNQNKEIPANETVYVVSGNEFDPATTSDNCEVASVENDFNGTATL